MLAKVGEKAPEEKEHQKTKQNQIVSCQNLTLWDVNRLAGSNIAVDWPVSCRCIFIDHAEHNFAICDERDLRACVDIWKAVSYVS